MKQYSQEEIYEIMCTATERRDRAIREWLANPEVQKMLSSYDHLVKKR